MLTDRTVKGLKPKDTTYEEMCDTHPGFGVRVNVGGQRTFIYRYRFAGRLRRLKIGVYPGVSVKDARAAYTAARARHQAGRDPSLGKLDSVKDLAALYMADVRLERRERTAVEYQRILDADILPKIGRRKVSTVTKAILKDLVETKARQRSSQARRMLSVLRGLFNKALAEDIIEVSPVITLKMPKKPPARSNVLSNADILRLLNTPNGKIKDLLVCSLLTAQRVGELARMEWHEIDGRTWNLPEEKAKNGQANTIPLSKTVMAILEAQESENQYVFDSTGRSGYLRVDSLSTWCERQGFSWRPHDLRRTATTRLARAGVSRLIVDRLLNHVDSTATNAYDRHRYVKEMRKALKRLETQLKKE